MKLLVLVAYLFAGHPVLAYSTSNRC